MPSTLFEASKGQSPIASARQQFDNFQICSPNANLQHDLRHGWLLPSLVNLDDALWKRWAYWVLCTESQALPDDPIPRLDILDFPHARTRKMLEGSLNCIPQHGSWQSWGGWQYFDYLLSWLLYGFGHKGQSELPDEPSGCQGASNRLYQVFCLDAMLLWPYDYFGDLLTENSYGKKQGFYPTPHTICEFMTRMLIDEAKDSRSETVCDPCVGTGRMLLHASNHSLRLYGMDIDATVCKATLVNGFLYAPWLVRPFHFLDAPLAAFENAASSKSPATHQFAASLSDLMTRSAPDHAQSYLSNSEYDPAEQRAVAPLLKRRRRKSDVDPTQGTLF